MLTGPSSRRNSSVLAGISSGRSLRICSWSGFCSSASTALPMRFTVVSWPATSSRNAIETSSSVVSRSPASSVCTSAEKNVSFGSASAMAVTCWSRNAAIAPPAASTCSGVPKVSSWLDHSRKSSRLSIGIPSSSQITVMGSGNAKTSSRSTSSPSFSLEISSAAISCTRGRSSSTRRAVNALVTSLRSRVWCGGSRLSMFAENRGSNRRTCSGAGECTTMRWPPSMTFLLTSGAVRAIFASSYRVTSQTLSPRGMWTSCTGPSARNMSCTSCGFWT